MKGVPQKTRPSDVAEGLFLFPGTLPPRGIPPKTQNRIKPVKLEEKSRFVNTSPSLQRHALPIAWRDGGDLWADLLTIHAALTTHHRANGAKRS